MQTVSGLFDSYADASAALRGLHAAGIPNADLSVISGDENAAEPAKPSRLPSTPDGGDREAEAGVVLGGAGGLLAGGGLVVIPGIGPVLAGGWLLADAAGAINGSIIGALVAGGVPEADAHVYAEGLRRGGTVVSARNEAAQAVETIFEASHAVDIATRRADFERDGWTGFDEAGAPLTTVKRAAATQATGA